MKQCTECGATEFMVRGKDKCLKCITGKKTGKINIGIDCGVKTGFAVWNSSSQSFEEISTLKIHQAIDSVLEYHRIYGKDLFVRFEDARKRKWFGSTGREKLQGAGSVKRDSKIWDDFLKDNKINYEAVAPAENTTKLSAEQFQNITKYTRTTSVHSRDAAMLVFGIK